MERRLESSRDAASIISHPPEWFFFTRGMAYDYVPSHLAHAAHTHKHRLAATGPDNTTITPRRSTETMLESPSVDRCSGQ
ncbi:hypothetical protein Hypma_004196 [Hypsizygus marmoreus]|uniref:Uncharacterized protein n=1 Tax=Hypsizygus marmoreus TaxID=39966 RepID=A0A369J4T5_HYPMA|nr:hypothetical protein Hypma_004196 [Hypsizygus marmoreus]